MSDNLSRIAVASLKNICLITVAAACALSPIGNSRAQNAVPPAASKTGEIADAANKFLATLDEAQRGKVIYDFKDDTQRKRWSNFPTTVVRRGGLRLGDLTQPQRDAAMAVVAAVLSPQGYEKVLQIMEGDEVLKKAESGGGGPGGRSGGPGGRGRGGRSGPPDGPGGFSGGGPGGPGGGGGPGGMDGATLFGRDSYYISFLGKPSVSEPWMMQYGGHHLGLNITFDGAHATFAPSHTGAQPAVYEIESKTVRVFGREIDKAFALMGSLNAAQRKQATLGFQMRDLVLGPGRDGQTIQPEGVKGVDLTDAQREMLLDLASEWTGLMNETVAKAKLEDMRKNLAETWFAWSGPTEKGAAAYFRIQGPTVIIEFAPQGIGGDPTKHFHTIYREPGNDYGAGFMAQGK